MATCERHGLAVGPRGRCVICRREHNERLASLDEQGHRRARSAARIVVAVAAGLATFALILAWLDTRPSLPAGTGEQHHD
jgi:hypothetical protein